MLSLYTDWARKLGLIRKSSHFVSSISDERGEELTYGMYLWSVDVCVVSIHVWCFFTIFPHNFTYIFHLYAFCPAGMPISEIIEQKMGVGGVVGMLTLHSLVVLCVCVVRCYAFCMLYVSMARFALVSQKAARIRVTFYRNDSYGDCRSRCAFLIMILLTLFLNFQVSSFQYYSGPAVSGAHNTIVAARAGKDLISSLVSGMWNVINSIWFG